MNVGYAQTAITPSLNRPVYLAGFAHNRRAEAVHDDLYARALALSDGQTTLVLCALDLIGFFRPHVYEVIAQVNRPDVHILIASTHTHHGPDTMGLWGPDWKTRGVDDVYLEDVKKRIAQTISSALAALQPASVKSASVHLPGLAKNARNPEIVDDELTVLQCLNAENRPLVTLFNFPCHPEVLWDGNPHITSDYVHYLRQEAEHQTGAPCIFFAGALGGMMTPDVKDHSFAEAEAMGRVLAEAGLNALNTVSGEQSSVISYQSSILRVPLTNPLYKLAFWWKVLPDVREHGRVTTEVNLLKIGGLWLATVPGELLPKLGLALKAQMRAAGAEVTGILGLANDELGYILPIEDFKYPLNPFRPGTHYEETNSIGKDIGPMTMEAIQLLIEGGLQQARGPVEQIPNQESQ